MNFKAVDLDDDEITIAILDFCSLLDEQGAELVQRGDVLRRDFHRAATASPQPARLCAVLINLVSQLASQVVAPL